MENILFQESLVRDNMIIFCKSAEYYAPFKWNELQTALKLHSYISHRDFKALLSEAFYDSNSLFPTFWFV